MGRRVAFALLLFTATAASAQPARVTGTVVDRMTGLPLPGAHVFVSGTSIGDATDSRGRFEIKVGPGSARLTATMLGYRTARTDRLIEAGDTVAIAFQLPPDALALGSVEVVKDRDAAWKQALEQFVSVFFGATPNAERTALLNPEVLDLSMDRERRLDAVADAPLVVRNDGLGYELTFYDLLLKAERADRAWAGTVSYRDLCEDRPCRAAVADARSQAYLGSPSHFLHALTQRRLEDEGFSMERVENPGHPGGSALDGVGNVFGLGGDDAVDLRPAPFGWEVETGGALRVVYAGERDGRPGRDGNQVSWLVAEGGVLRLSADGDILDPDAVIRYGYWDWERAADTVPHNYRPTPPRP